MQCILIFFFIFVSYTFSFSAVKRLMKEAAELKDPTDHYHAQPLEVCFSMCLQELVIRLLLVYTLSSLCAYVFEMYKCRY